MTQGGALKIKTRPVKPSGTKGRGGAIYQDFNINVAHIMENLRDHYNIPMEQVVIIENMDNCIDDKGYTRVEFETSEDKFTIKMYGSGIPEDVLLGTLPTIAGTTKGGQDRLGHYGWGMKVGLWIASPIRITTRKGSFTAVQEWTMSKHGVPAYRNLLNAKTGLTEDMTIVEHVLNAEYRGKITADEVKRTLISYYPTIVSGRCVMGRPLQIKVNGEELSLREPEHDTSMPVELGIRSRKACGRFYYLQRGYTEGTGMGGLGAGILVIVNGRVIKSDAFGQMTDKLTGYIHADLLASEVTADKTTIRPSSLWYEFRKKVGAELDKMLEDAGETGEASWSPQVARALSKELNSVVRDFETYFGEFNARSREHRAHEGAPGGGQAGARPGAGPTGVNATAGIFASAGAGSAAVISAGVGTAGEGSSPETAGKHAAGRKRKFGLSIMPTFRPDLAKEAWFNFSEATVYVNTSFPTYERAAASKNKTVVTYHCLRCAFDALTEFIMKEKKFTKDIDQFFNQRSEILTKWCEKWMCRTKSHQA